MVGPANRRCSVLAYEGIAAFRRADATRQYCVSRLRGGTAGRPQTWRACGAARHRPRARRRSLVRCTAPPQRCSHRWIRYGPHKEDIQESDAYTPCSSRVTSRDAKPLSSVRQTEAATLRVPGLRLRERESRAAVRGKGDLTDHAHARHGPFAPVPPAEAVGTARRFARPFQADVNYGFPAPDRERGAFSDARLMYMDHAVRAHQAADTIMPDHRRPYATCKSRQSRQARSAVPGRTGLRTPTAPPGAARPRGVARTEMPSGGGRHHPATQ